MYHYTAYIKEVYDGDTVKAIVDLGFTRYQEMTLQLYGVNASGFHENEFIRRKEAKDVLQDLILNKEVEIYTFKEKKGEFGTYLATVIMDGLDVNHWLVQNEVARQYSA
jgi:micrococcal nuclease